MLYREPKLLKAQHYRVGLPTTPVSVLYREPKLLKVRKGGRTRLVHRVSVLYREPKLLKDKYPLSRNLYPARGTVSVLYREPKLLKAVISKRCSSRRTRFSALP